MKTFIGQQLLIHCYKHDGLPHRCWDKSILLEETDKHFITINDHVLVTEADGRTWYTREPAICYFPKDGWYNVICMIRKSGVFYYCNIASPTLYDGEALKYIDYDLDLKVFPDYHYKILDESEYEAHRRYYHYSDKLDDIFHEQLDRLIDMSQNLKGPFQPDFPTKWYNFYLQLEGE